MVPTLRRPVKVGSGEAAGRRIRMHLELKELQDIEGGAQAIMVLTFEREGHEKPVCVAESVSRWYV